MLYTLLIMHLCRSNQQNQAPIRLQFRVRVCAWATRVWQDCRSFIIHQKSLEKLCTPQVSFGELSPWQSLVNQIQTSALCQTVKQHLELCSYVSPSYLFSGHISHSEQKTHARQVWQSWNWKVISSPCLPDHIDLSKLFQTSQVQCYYS